MSKTEETKYHAKRQPFIIFPKTGVLFAEYGSAMSHNDMLKNLNFETQTVRNIIMNFPRGYYMDSNLVFYQGDDMTEGKTWTVAPENLPVIKHYLPDLMRFFRLNNTVNVYLGVRVGRIGDVWELQNKTSVENLQGNNR